MTHDPIQALAVRLGTPAGEQWLVSDRANLRDRYGPLVEGLLCAAVFENDVSKAWEFAAHVTPDAEYRIVQLTENTCEIEYASSVEDIRGSSRVYAMPGCDPEIAAIISATAAVHDHMMRPDFNVSP